MVYGGSQFAFWVVAVAADADGFGFAVVGVGGAEAEIAGAGSVDAIVLDVASGSTWVGSVAPALALACPISRGRGAPSSDAPPLPIQIATPPHTASAARTPAMASGRLLVGTPPSASSSRDTGTAV